jgi:hypothetical protein
MTMSDNIRVHGLHSDNAILLLAAAEELGLDASVVRTSTTGGFDVPKEVAEKAGFDENGVPSTKAAKAAAQEVEDREREQAERDQQAIDALRGDTAGSTVTAGETGATAKADAEGKPKRAPRKTAAKKAAAPAASKE